MVPCENAGFQKGSLHDHQEQREDVEGSQTQPESEEDFPLAPFPVTPEAYASPHRESSKAKPQSSQIWFERAEWRKGIIDKYCWNESKALYFDYDTVQEKQSLYESVTAFWTLWAGCASEEQCWKLMCVFRFFRTRWAGS